MSPRGGAALALAAVLVAGGTSLAAGVQRVPRSALSRPTPAHGLPQDPLGARLLRDAPLRSRPGGPVIAQVAPRTEYGSRTVLAVARRHPGWVGVHSTQAGNNRVGWVAAVNTQLVREPVTVDIDVSSRRMVVRRSGRFVMGAEVGVGAPGSPTPAGTYGVTDVLRPAAGSPYGCCILALTGHQPTLPSGWSGGDRLAVHGTSAPSTVGRAASAGCLHASAAVMRRLLATVPLGSTVRIHA